MNAKIQPLFTSELFGVYDFKCLEHKGTRSGTEWGESFSINFTRQGNFGYHLDGQDYDIHSGVILLENADTEYAVSHDHHVRDECTSLCVNRNLLSEIALSLRYPYYDGQVDEDAAFGFGTPVVAATPELEHLHALIYGLTTSSRADRALKLEMVAISLLQRLLTTMYKDENTGVTSHLDRKTKERYLEIADRGKYYILNHFQNEIRLQEIAHHAYASPFHFSRVFKQITSHTPYQYLIQVRLNHARLLLLNTTLPVTEICFEAGFNSLEHFITAFKNRYRQSPRRFRQRGPHLT